MLSQYELYVHTELAVQRERELARAARRRQWLTELQSARVADRVAPVWARLRTVLALW